ncbi:hypothetical protein BALOs_1161 [Halobacteriovorax sp. BALOs_7]|uniref:hypothetical protein n=1 Tax=Halobacteriovorax sp. BALOs_7 TaxID=2109558 RepID=UPI000EA1671A|nr:hypothetical protein [Halobacteriovorax sp. BALOs_7]AYF44168.1 hypothetical protein BALOs_1161 [Halobacteriovorax sp. BALOs_7]
MNNLKPQDIVIAIKLNILENENFSMRDLASSLNISLSEISSGIKRLVFANIVASNKKRVNKSALYEFLVHGIKYAFPTTLGPIKRGVPTSFSESSLKSYVSTKDTIVWAHADGTTKGISIEPLYRSVPEAVMQDKHLHRLLAIIDMIRVGRAREQKIAIELLKKELL